jgi:hypothetical protein
MNLQVIKNRIAKILAYTVTAILFFFISAFLILQIPPVQSYFISKFLKNFTAVTGFRTTIEGFRMLWFDRLELERVAVIDPEGNKMISAKTILINFKLSQLFEKKNINIDGVYLDSAHVLLTKVNEIDSLRDLNMNVFIANINAHYGGTSGGGGSPPKINIGEAFINKSQFTYINQDRDTVPKGFDYNHFSLSVDEGQLNSFVMLGDTTEFNLRTLIAQDIKTKFKVNQLSTFFRLCQTSMEFVGLDLHAGQSVITDTVLFRYQGLTALNEFVNNVRIHANLVNTTIYPKDLEFFAPGVERVEQPLNLQGVFNGRVNKFKFTNMKVDVGKTHLTGSIDMDGLPNINETFMIVDLRKSQVDPNDLAFLFNDNTLKRLLPMGRMELDGQFLGYPNDFVANGKFSGALGEITSDINFKVNEKDIDRSMYSGHLSLSNFDLGRYLNDSVTFQTVNMDGQVIGSGLTQNTADFRLDGQVYSVGIKGYNYRNIVTNARLTSEQFNGMIDIDDPNLQIKARGSIDLRDGKNLVNIEAQLDTANFHRLNLSRDSLFVHADFVANIRGLSLDSLEGTADFQNFQINYIKESLYLDTIHLYAERHDNERTVVLETPLADAKISGVYLLTDLYKNIRTLSQEISLNIKNNEIATTDYYKNKTYRPQSYQANINIKLKDIKPISTLLGVDLSLSRNTLIEGSFTSGYTTILQVFTHFDSLKYNNNLLLNTDVDLTASKIADSTSVLAMASINSERQSFGRTLHTSSLLAEAIWNKSHIDFGLDADQVGQTNNIRLKGAVDFSKDSTTISMAPSALKLLEREWSFASDNFTSIRGKDWRFHHLALINNEQSVGLDGQLSDDPAKILTMDISNLDLSLLNVITGKKFTGIVDANLKLSNYYKDPSLQNDITINALTINDFLIGDVSGKNQWDTLNNKFGINIFIDRMQERIVNLTGEYEPSDKKSPLNVVANLEKANLKIIEPFIDDIFSNIGGTISGEFDITGQLSSPQIRGEGTMSEAQIMINYIKTMYRITGKVGLTPNSIYFKDIELTDTFKNKGKLNGALTHTDFRSMAINLEGSFRNFQVLNTSLKDNNLFYGQAYASGTVAIKGPIANLNITSDARTEKNTRVYIPISGSSSTDQKEFIDFVNFTDTTQTTTIATALSKKVNLTGLTFDLNLDVTPDAYCEIIFDLKAGDIIRGRGNGDLRMQIDTKGEFNMFGAIEFTEGWYNFTLYDIINKEFEIKKGSRITWLGDPYQGVLDIDASYNQLASLLPLAQVSYPGAEDAPQVRRKYPVQVLLALDGPMLNPQINFDILAKDLPQNIQIPDGPAVNLDFVFTAFKNKLDEQELKRQVFSLIVLRRFSPPESFDTSGSVVSSLSELLSNQLSYWMSQVDENLEIDVDIASMDQESFNTFQLRFAYTFMNGRLRVSGDGTFNNTSSQPTGNQANPSSVAGDWTVDYKLTADGKLRVKMYSRTNYNPLLNTVSTQTAMTTGASIIHTQSFDDLKDLFTSSRKQRKREEENARLNEDAVKEDDGSE